MSRPILKVNGTECYKIKKYSGSEKQTLSKISGSDNSPAPKFFSMFEDGTGTTSADLSVGGTSHTAELFSDVASSPTWYSPAAGGTYAVATGVGHAVKIDHHSDFDWEVDGKWCFSTYTATLSNTYAGCLVKRNDGTGGYRGFALYFKNGAVELYVVDYYSSDALHVQGTGSFTGSTWSGPSTNIKDGNWHHVVVSWDGTSSQDSSALTMWIDGVKHTVGNGKLAVNAGIDNMDSSSTITNSVDIYLSNSSDTTVYPSGGVDHTALWNDFSLNDEQVALLYNSGTPIDVRRGL